MKSREKGQGLVEYALILVLVAIAVIALLRLDNTPPQNIFCSLVETPLWGDVRYHPISEREMSIREEELSIDVKTDMDQTCLQYVEFEDIDIDTFPSHGTVVYSGEGVFTYRPGEVGSGTADSFTYIWAWGWEHHTGKVTIIIKETDNPSVSQATIMSSGELDTLELENVKQSIVALLEEATAQEESIEEGGDLAVEAVVEGIEVLIDYADDYDKQTLSEALSQLLQDVKDGNEDAVLGAITWLATDLAEAPLEVAIAMSLKMAPRLIDSLAMVSGGIVSPDTIAAAQQALEQLDPDYPGKTEALQLLQGGIDIIEEGRLAGEVIAEADCAALGAIITLLESAGEEGWAEQFAADSEACGF